MPFCENCGETIEPGSKFCDNCGVPIDDPSTPQPASLPPPPQAPTFQGSPAPAAPPASAPIPPIYIAAGIVVVVIIIALVFASGVLSTVAPAKDPIIGVWRYADSTAEDTRIRFNADGTLVVSTYYTYDKVTDVIYGTWSAQGSNLYTLTAGNGYSDPVTYDPTKKALYSPKFPEKLLIPYSGDVMAASTSTPTVKTTTLPVTTMAVPGTGTAKDWNSLGNDLHDNKKDYRGALYAFEKAISLDPNEALYWRNKGVTLDNLQRYSEALIAEEKAISLNPNYFNPWLDKSLVFLHLGKYSEALVAAEKAITLDPTNKFAWNNKGVALNNLNRYSEALTAYDEAIALDPTYQTAITNKKNLETKMNK